MGADSKIEWTEQTWNPIVGCRRVSEGCRHCYAEGMAKRLAAMGLEKYQGLLDEHGRWNGAFNIDGAALTAPLKRTTPTTYFVNSMGDLFLEGVPDKAIDQVWLTMLLCPHHTFQVLTKRPDRMETYLATSEDFAGAALRNVWLGTSVENQAAADERIPHLLRCPAAVRFLSCEPLLGALDLRRVAIKRATPDERARGKPDVTIDALAGWYGPTSGAERTKINWVIVGGESGPGARPMHPDWARSLRDQCVAAGVPFFFKQWGEWTPGENVKRMRKKCEGASWFNDQWDFSTEYWDYEGHVDDEPDLYRVGKREAGRVLDGREWDEMPAREHPQTRLGVAQGELDRLRVRKL